MKRAAPADPDEEVERRVQDLLAQMTLEEKLEQMAGSGTLEETIDYGGDTHDTPDNVRLGIPGAQIHRRPPGRHVGRVDVLSGPYGQGGGVGP